MNNPLLDKEFLKKLDNHREKEVWAKIIALTNDEEPVEEITGEISGGDIGLDGSSSIRRTCSLQMVAKDININNYYWGLKNKFKLEIGLTNRIDPNYPGIIWFPQGTYVITNFSTSHTTNNYTVSIQGQDKMCLLNGTVGGSLTALSYRFDVYDDENGVSHKIPLKTIISEMVHEYAREPYKNIIINDLDDQALELLEYKRQTPMWMFVGATGDNEGIVINATINKDTIIYLVEDSKNEGITIADFDACATNKTTVNGVKCVYDSKINIEDMIAEKPTLIRKVSTLGGLKYTLWKISNGETVGYKISDIIYPGELIESVGTPVTSVLDKLKNMLGNFEYFYDDDGRFVFQKKRIFLDESWNNIVENSNDSIYVENAAYTSPFEYIFENDKLISSFSNSPNLNNIKNDYSIWGVKKSVTGNEIPVHLRYAIDKKPFYYHSLNVNNNEAIEIDRELSDKAGTKTQTGREYYTSDYKQDEGTVDWRELIYRMALDFRRYGHWSKFNIKLNEVNKINGEPLYFNGVTGYQQYYTDMEGFWRQLYNPDLKQNLMSLYSDNQILTQKEKFQEYLQKKEKAKALEVLSIDIFILQEEIKNTENNEETKVVYQKILDNLLNAQKIIEEWGLENWSEQILDSPELLNFWFDFLDIDGELAQFAVPVIGNRPVAINDTAIKGIYFKETPLVIFVKTEEKEEK